MLSEALVLGARARRVLLLGSLIDGRIRCAESNSRTTCDRACSSAGIVGGLAILDPPGDVVLPAAGGDCGCSAQRRARAGAAIVAVGALLVVAPWTLRNYRVYGRFVLVASEGGVTFWTGNHPLAHGEGDLAANPAIKRAELAARARRTRPAR